MPLTKLGINIDHVATLRQARKENFPDPVALAEAALRGGADGLTAHLREDRRHIQDDDMKRLVRLPLPLNMEMANDPQVVALACQVKPQWACLVPEKREELTTEGGLNVPQNKIKLTKTIEALHRHGIRVSLFIDPDEDILSTLIDLKADAVEIHTGHYARVWRARFHKQECSGTNLAFNSSFDFELKKIVRFANMVKKEGLLVNAGHGLDYQNVGELARAFEFNEFNIGFAVVAHALDVGMETAVREMKTTIKQACAEFLDT